MSVKDHIQQLGGAFMFSREAREFARTTGVDGFLGPYVKGRGSVLGDVDADVVTAAFGFFPPDSVRACWESVKMPAAEARAGYARAAQEYGRRKLGSFAEAGRLADLMQRVVDAAEVGGVPLFAGWRAVEMPEDGPARVQQLGHVLRELRGGLHFLAVRSQGLSPLEAVVIGGSPLAEGTEQARRFGWPEPYEKPTPETRARWEAAEALTDVLIAPAFAVLSEAEHGELAESLAKAHATTFSS